VAMARCKLDELAARCALCQHQARGQCKWVAMARPHVHVSPVISLGSEGEGERLKESGVVSGREGERLGEKPQALLPSRRDNGGKGVPLRRALT
jgi:hypothetical protein